MNTRRYKYVGEDQSKVLCTDCSTRASGVMIPADEIEDHDAFHSMEGFKANMVYLRAGTPDFEALKAHVEYAEKSDSYIRLEFERGTDAANLPHVIVKAYEQGWTAPLTTQDARGGY